MIHAAVPLNPTHPALLCEIMTPLLDFREQRNAPEDGRSASMSAAFTPSRAILFRLPGGW